MQSGFVFVKTCVVKDFSRKDAMAGKQKQFSSVVFWFQLRIFHRYQSSVCYVFVIHLFNNHGDFIGDEAT
jgi:hypothetical protein